MTYIPYSPATPAPATVDAVDDSLRLVAAARERVEPVHVACGGLAGELRWQSRTGERCRELLGELRGDIDRARRCVREASASLRGARSRAVAAGVGG